MLNINVHRNILLQILKDIYSDIELGPLLGFKGGTAAYLFYQLNRFSVDLDFDLLDAAKEETVFDKISAVLSTYGQIKDSQHKRYTIFFLMSYHHDAYNIKVEISRRHFGSSYETKNYLGIPMLVMLRPDMFAHKLVAMIEREGSAHRDIMIFGFFLKIVGRLIRSL